MTHIVGHEGKGSLYSKLASENLITSLSSGGSNQYKGLFQRFYIVINLTTKGMENYEKVIFYVGLFLKMLKENKLEEWIHKECQNKLNIAYRFQESSNALVKASSLTEKFSSDLLDPNMEEINALGYTMADFDEKEVRFILNQLNSENCLIILTNKELEKVENLEAEKFGEKKVEPMFNTEYFIRDIFENESSLIENNQENTKVQELTKIDSDFGKDKY